MKTLSSLLLLLLSFTTLGETLKTRVAKIVLSEGPGRPELFLFENGRVGRLSEEKKSALRLTLKEAKENDSLLQIDLDERGEVRDLKILEQSEKNLNEDDPLPVIGPFRPTVLRNYGEAQSIFQHLNRRHQRDSQCYNRAHIWAFEEWRRIGLQSLKLFMFFTKSYIWEYNYEWWFHVTPLTYVGSTPVTLDRTFNRAPLTIKDWTLGFIKSRRDCPIITRYSHYEQNQMTEHCYLIPATMYFWQPRDLEAYEQTGKYKENFIPSEVNHAYWEAF